MFEFGSAYLSNVRARLELEKIMQNDVRARLGSSSSLFANNAHLCSILARLVVRLKACLIDRLEIRLFGARFRAHQQLVYQLVCELV